jgi:hypothetical protein
MVFRIRRGKVLDVSEDGTAPHIEDVACRISEITAELFRHYGRLAKVFDIEIEAFWRSKLKAFRARVLGIGDRLRHLPPRDHVRLTTELRAALTELAEERGRA